MRVKVRLVLLGIVLLLPSFFPSEVSAETRLYHLRITLRNGQRYETISAYDPVNYCRINGGTVIHLRDYFLIFSPEMKVKILHTWMETDGNLHERFADILRARNMLANANYRFLPRVNPLTWRDMQKPE